MAKIFMQLRSLLVVGLLCLCCDYVYAAEYQVISLGDFYGHGMNNSGQLAGERNLGNGSIHACIRDDNAGVQDLGALGGNGYEWSVAYDISSSGQAVGRTTTSEGYDHAFLWDSTNGMQDLGTLGGHYSFAYGINSSGEVVGEANTGVCQGVACNNAFIWNSSNGMQGLGTLGGNFSAAFDINNSGKVVGMSYNSFLNHAFVWDSMNGMRDIGLFAGADKSSQANAINDAGQVVGFSTSSYYSSWPDPHYPSTAFIWDEVNGIHDLGTLGYSSVATDINNLGQVVGYNVFHSSEYYWERAFIWDSVNGMRELKDLIPQNSGWFLSRAEAINDAGQIVVAGYNENNYYDGTRAFLLTPTAAPEPIRIAGPTPVYYSSLQSAYDDAGDEDIIQSRVVILSEDLYIDGSKSVTIRGGYASDYAMSNGITILNGNIVISNGTLTIDNIKLVL